MNILVTGARGFIARNLRLRLADEGGALSIMLADRQTSAEALRGLAADADVIFHLAGANRPADPAEFTRTNETLTRDLCDGAASGRRARVVFASSIHAASETPYGVSKRNAEHALRDYAAETGAAVDIYRLPNVFGKWSRANYNSVVATFCHNTARGIPLRIDRADAVVPLLYVDDLIDRWVEQLRRPAAGLRLLDAAPLYTATVGDLARIISDFPAQRERLLTPRAGAGLVRALYATYLSYLGPEQFDQPLRVVSDPRGRFSELLKTEDSGQFSFFTAGPGVTRGGHFHHTKNERFVVVQGEALFRFRHLDTGARHELHVSGAEPRVVETVPGWVHDITNVGTVELIALLWANEAFDPARPDTYLRPIDPDR